MKFGGATVQGNRMKESFHQRTMLFIHEYCKWRKTDPTGKGGEKHITQTPVDDNDKACDGSWMHKAC